MHHRHVGSQPLDQCRAHGAARFELDDFLHALQVANVLARQVKNATKAEQAEQPLLDLEQLHIDLRGKPLPVLDRLEQQVLANRRGRVTRACPLHGECHLHDSRKMFPLQVVEAPRRPPKLPH